MRAITKSWAKLALIGGSLGIVVGILTLVDASDVENKVQLSDSIEVHARGAGSSTNALMKLTDSNEADLRHSISLHVLRSTGAPLENATVSIAHEAVRVSTLGPGRFELSADGELPKTFVLIEAPGHWPDLVGPQDEGWSLGKIEATLEQSLSLRASVSDLASGDPINARVSIGTPKLTRIPTLSSIPIEWKDRLTPTISLTSSTVGQVSFVLPESVDRVLLNAEALGYFPVRGQVVSLADKSRHKVEDVSLALAPVLVAGLRIETGVIDLSPKHLGHLETSHVARHGLTPGCPQDVRLSIETHLDTKLGSTSRSVLWCFGVWRPIDGFDSTLPLEAEFSYRPFPGSQAYEGRLAYRRVDDLLASDIVSLDLSKEAAQRLARVEVEFVGKDSAVGQYPEGSWSVSSLDDPSMHVRPVEVPSPDANEIVFVFLVGSGNYRVGPRSGFFDEAGFASVDLTVAPAETKRVQVESPSPSIGNVEITVLLEGVPYSELVWLAIRRDGRKGLITKQVRGKDNLKLRGGDYVIEFSHPEFTSEKRQISVVPGETLDVTFSFP